MRNLTDRPQGPTAPPRAALRTTRVHLVAPRGARGRVAAGLAERQARPALPDRLGVGPESDRPRSGPTASPAGATTVLVTGVSGHAGGHLAAHLSSKGLAVRALVRTQEQAEFVRQQGWTPAQGDLTEPETLFAALQGVELVLHSATARASPSLGSGPIYEAVNVTGTRELAERALNAGVRRFVHISTISVHGGILPPLVDEGTPLATQDPHPYGSTKARAEVELEKVRARGLPVAVLRAGMITHWVRSQWGDEMVERLRTGGWPSALHPEDVLPWVHSVNLAEMSWLALTHESVPSEAFIAADRNVSFRELYGPVVAALGKPVSAPDRAPRVSISQLGKIRSRLGYAPIYSFEETVARLVGLATRTGPRAPRGD